MPRGTGDDDDDGLLIHHHRLRKKVRWGGVLGGWLVGGGEPWHAIMLEIGLDSIRLYSIRVRMSSIRVRMSIFGIRMELAWTVSYEKILAYYYYHYHYYYYYYYYYYYPTPGSRQLHALQPPNLPFWLIEHQLRNLCFAICHNFNHLSHWPHIRTPRIRLLRTFQPYKPR